VIFFLPISVCFLYYDAPFPKVDVLLIIEDSFRSTTFGRTPLE